MRTLNIREYTLEVEPMRFLDVQTYSKELRRRANKLELLSTLEKRYNKDIMSDGNIEEITAKMEKIENDRDEAETVLFDKMLQIAKSSVRSIKKGEELIEPSVVDSFSAEEVGQINDIVLGNITKKN